MHNDSTKITDGRKSSVFGATTLKAASILVTYTLVVISPVSALPSDTVEDVQPTIYIEAPGAPVSGDASAKVGIMGKRDPLDQHSTHLINVEPGAADDQFGYSVSISGDTAVIGARYDDVGPNVNQGSAYVFVRSGNSWILQAQLTANDGRANDFFGYSVSISGDTALVGSRSDDVGNMTDQGSVYVFTRDINMTWSQQAQLVSGDGAAGDAFGSDVAIIGNSALVSALFDDVGINSNQGSAYVFSRSGTTWVEDAKLIASDGAPGDQFGWSVATAGSTVLIGANVDDVGSNSAQGSAYIFDNSSGSWVQVTKLVASDGGLNDFFGSSVAITDNTALIGAWGDGQIVNSQVGAAYVFTRVGNTWTAQAKLLASDGAIGDRFGFSVALSGGTALVAAHYDASRKGAAYIYTGTGSTWNEQAKLVADEGQTGDELGFSAALSGETALAGAYLRDVGSNSDQGAANFFVRTNTSWVQLSAASVGDTVFRNGYETP